jgi:hypothetical protein
VRQDGGLADHLDGERLTQTRRDLRELDLGGDRVGPPQLADAREHVAQMTEQAADLRPGHGRVARRAHRNRPVAARNLGTLPILAQRLVDVERPLAPLAIIVAVLGGALVLVRLAVEAAGALVLRTLALVVRHVLTGFGLGK